MKSWYINFRNNIAIGNKFYKLILWKKLKNSTPISSEHLYFSHPLAVPHASLLTAQFFAFMEAFHFEEPGIWVGLGPTLVPLAHIFLFWPWTLVLWSCRLIFTPALSGGSMVSDFYSSIKWRIHGLYFCLLILVSSLDWFYLNEFNSVLSLNFDYFFNI